MATFFREVLKDIRSGHNLDVYIAALLNLVLAILSVLNILPFEILGAAILASISWLTLHALSERRESKAQLTEITRLVQETKGPVKVADFFIENYVDNSEEFKKQFRSTRELSVIGMGQSRMVIGYGGQIKRILSEGGKVRFILMDPNSTAIEMAAKRLSAAPSIDRVRQEHWSAIERLASMILDSSARGELTIKFIKLLLPYTMYAFDLHEPNKGMIYIWITPFKEPSERRPGFALSAERDPYWFDFFRSQFENLWSWSEAEPCDLSVIANKRSS